MFTLGSISRKNLRFFFPVSLSIFLCVRICVPTHFFARVSRRDLHMKNICVATQILLMLAFSPKPDLILWANEIAPFEHVTQKKSYLVEMVGVEDFSMSSQENQANVMEDSPPMVSEEVRDGVNYVMLTLDKDIEVIGEDIPEIPVPEDEQVIVKIEPGQEDKFIKKKTKKSQGGRRNPNWSETQTEALHVFCCQWRSVLQGNITQKLRKEMKLAKWEECAKHVSK